MGKKKVANFLYEDLSYKIRGCVFNVYNSLGFGHKENIYQKALAIEFNKAGIKFEKEKSLPIKYGEKELGKYRPDFVIENKIIIETKTVEFMPKNYETQLVYYLRGTKFRLGFLINFGTPRLDIRRRINSNQR
ncbi:MAG: hypothetical protein UY23_C0001G0107 [Candidatus Jorgensenbacteria bacterium GW2011_GWA1_48_11]|uniref:GxxExxY protein n=1 Tax=Candidatus Jorgensenbacteria bacterium GW2011_GWA1_48_11 TaxID=1618660 RepID=A0A0G1UBG0_9BACT|nr:MAG: hypothetical protein UY23_C0001G0107 [Candidatus Jorgensenbacteria bacterium GW2011_GWA1_48_11]KKW11994.1 MAG: hypothetical protein UY51_C0005G0236 [Candidatus Jorgensenbacteria bacterium GW2011_GWB1_49_9]